MGEVQVLRVLLRKQQKQDKVVQSMGGDLRHAQEAEEITWESQNA